MDNPYDDIIDSINAQSVDGASVSTQDMEDYAAGEGTDVIPTVEQSKTYIDQQVFDAGNPLITLGSVTNAPTGLVDITNITVSWDNSTKVFTVAPKSGSETIYLKGIEHTIPSTSETCRNGYEFTIAEGMWYFVYEVDPTGLDLQLRAYQTMSFDNYAIVAAGYYDASVRDVVAQDYNTDDGGTATVLIGEVVKIATGSSYGNVGDYYRKTTADASITLATHNYTTGNWENVTGIVADVTYPNMLGGDLFNEFHSAEITTEEHKLRHVLDGTKWRTGLLTYHNALAGITQPTGNLESRIAVQGGEIWDEDYEIVIVNDATPDSDFEQDLGGTSNATAQTDPALIPIMYRYINSTITYWRMTKPFPVPFYHVYGTSYPYYDNAGTLTAVTAGYSVPYFIVACNHKKYPIIAVAGQAQYSTADAAMVDPYTAIDWGSINQFAPEMKVIARVVLETKASWSNSYHKCKISRFTDYRANTGSVINAGLVNNHSSLAGLDYAASGHTGFTRKISSTATPTTTDDITLGYMIGDKWADTDSYIVYECVDNREAAAVWIPKTTIPQQTAIGTISSKLDTSVVQQHGFLPKSQVVIAGSVDSDGKANFLSASTDGVALAATATPVLIAYANGQDLYGQKNYVEEISADVTKANTWGTLPAGTNYLYKELDITDPDNPVATYGSSLEQPDYVTADNQGQHSLMHMESNSDEYGKIWTLAGNATFGAQTHTGFGTNVLMLDGTGDYITSNFSITESPTWTVELFFKFTTANRDSTIITSSPSYNIQIDTTSANKIRWKISSNGSSWNILDTAPATVYTVNTWYHLAVVFTGSAYNCYINGTLEATATSSTVLISSPVRIGANETGANGFLGYIDEFRYSPFPQYTTAFTAPTSAFTKDAPIYNITLRKFPYIGTNKLRVYLGEAVSNGSTVSSVITYALNGEYESVEFTWTTGTRYSYAHNIGTNKVNRRAYAITKILQDGNAIGTFLDIITDDGSGTIQLNPVLHDRLNVAITTYSRLFASTSTGAPSTLGATNHRLKLIASRSF